MTQDVQPLTWQKRTNLEEHQQFFSKINEIIDNLAPTVDEAEAAIAQATAAIASANDAIATANAASAAASAAATQAQTAASTVAGYDTRLSQVENKASVNQANISSLSVLVADNADDITAIEGREADYLKKTGAAQTVTSQIMVPTTATGLRDTQIANGTRIQNDLAAYEPMVRNVGNQLVTGVKFTTLPQMCSSGITPYSSENPVYKKLYYLGTSGVSINLSFIACDRYNFALIHANYTSGNITGTGIVKGRNDTNNIGIGFFEDAEGVWLVGKRYASGATRLIVNHLFSMRGTSGFMPTATTEDLYLTDEDGTYYEITVM